MPVLALPACGCTAESSLLCSIAPPPPPPQVLAIHKLGFGWDGVQPGTFAEALVRCGQSGTVKDAGSGADLQLWGYLVWPAVGLVSALLLHRVVLAAYRGITKAIDSCERDRPYAYSRVGDTRAHPVDGSVV